jgi:hypothetical protein
VTKQVSGAAQFHVMCLVALPSGRWFLSWCLSSINLYGHLSPIEAATARLAQRSGNKAHFEHGGIFMTLQVVVPMSHLHERYFGRPSCPNCGETMTASEHPEFSECLSGDEIRHFWACDGCDNRFDTVVKFNAAGA